MQFSSLKGPVTVNLASYAALESAVRARFAAGTGFALATINLDHVVQLRKDTAFSDAYLAQDFVIADGNPIVWFSRLARKTVELLPGADMILPLTVIAASEGVPVALIGSTDATLKGAAKTMKEHAPEVEIVATIAPPMGFDPDSPEAEKVLRQAEEAGARMVFLALGAPKQERLAMRGRDIVPSVGFASIGAGLDFIAGTQNRAPEWVRQFALEWLWRALNNPRRLAVRYLRCFGVLPRLLLDAVRQRGDAAAGSQSPTPTPE